MKLDYKNCFKVGISAFILFLCIHYWTRFAGLVKIFFAAAMPLIIGGAIAYVINILMRFYEKHYFKNSKSKFVEKSRRPVCLLLSFLTLFALVFLLIRLVVPQLIESITLIVNEAPNTFKNIVKKAEKYELFRQLQKVLAMQLELFLEYYQLCSQVLLHFCWR